MKPNRYPIAILSPDLPAYLRSVGAVRGPFGWILPSQINVWEAVPR